MTRSAAALRQRVSGDTVRDLGTVAAGQLTLPYRIAAFGTMASYTQRLGVDEVARKMKSSGDEARQADEQHMALAKPLPG